MAERRIAEKTGQGVVCFISNYSWLDGLSFTGMRERYLEAYSTRSVSTMPERRQIQDLGQGRTGRKDPIRDDLFDFEGDPVGIQVGTSHRHCWCARRNPLSAHR